MINIYANKLDSKPVEQSNVTGVSIQKWLDDNAGYDRRPKPLWSIFLNGDRLTPYKDYDYVILDADTIDIYVEPRGVEVVLVGLVIASLAYSYYQYKNMPDNYANSTPAGSNIYDANARGNSPKLNGVIREAFGTHPIFPDMLNGSPRRYYSGNIEYVDLLLCVGRGEYDLGQLLIGDTDVSRYSGDLTYQMFPPSADLSGHSASQNWYQSKEVDNLKLENLAEELGPDWSADFTGTAMTASLSSTIQPFPIDAGEIFEILTSSSSNNIGVFRVVSKTTNVATCKKLKRIAASGGGFTYEPDASWSNFTNQTIDITWADLNGGENWEGPFSVVPDGEVCGKFEIDFSFPRGLANTGDDGELADKDVQVYVEYRDVDIAGAYTLVDTTQTLWIDSTTDELGFTVPIQITAPSISITGFTISNYTDTYGAAEHVGLKLSGSGSAFASLIVGHQVVLSDFSGDDVAINSGYYVRAKDDDDNIYISLTKVESSYAPVVSKTLSGIEKIQLSGIRPEVRFRRVTSDAADTSTIDLVFVKRLKGLLPSPSLFDGITTIAMTIKGTNAISGRAQNQVNGYFTRKIPVFSGANLTLTNESTNDISSVVAYLMANSGYQYSDIDMPSLKILHDKCVASGQTFSALFEQDITLFDALKRVLLCGFAEPTIEAGKLSFFRDEVRATYDYLYTPQKITGVIDRSLEFYSDGDTDGALVEYFNKTSKTTEKILCVLADQDGLRPKKIRAFGVTDRTQAWRLGMRLARRQRLKPTQYKFSTEMDALNSAYGSSDGIADDLIVGSSQGRLIDVDVTEQIITLDQDVTLDPSKTYKIIFTEQNGRISTFFTVTATENTRVFNIDAPIDFAYLLDGSIDPPTYTMGLEDDFFIHIITKKVTPLGDGVSVVGEEYLEEIYADDAGNPDYGPAVSGAKTFVSDLLSGAFPWTPVNIHIDNSFEVTKDKREAHGPATFGGSTWDTLYTATYFNDEILLNGVALFTLAGITDFDIDFDGAGYPVVSYTDGSGLSNYTHQDTTHTLIDGAATNPFIANELPEDANAGLIVGYEVGTDAAYRLSHESYATERIAADLTGGGELVKMGIGEENPISIPIPDHHYPLDEFSGDIYDVIDNVGYTAPVDAVYGQVGVSGTAIGLPQGSGAAALANVATMDMTDEWYIGGYIKNRAGGNPQYIFKNRFGLILNTDAVSVIGVPAQVKLYNFGASSNIAVHSYSTDPFIDGEIVHLAARSMYVNPTTWRYDIFVNGVVVATGTYSDAIDGGSDVTEIGRGEIAQDHAYWFDDIRMYERALSDQEALAIIQQSTLWKRLAMKFTPPAVEV